ncbi:MAG: Rab family GTPase, partial [Candidatus Thorarchaeota archaeon]
LVFANKVDLIDEKSLDTAPIEKIVKENGFLGFYITSAKTGKGVIDAFNAIIDELYHKYKGLSDEL